MPKRKALIVSLALSLAALCGASGYAATVCVSSGDCHVCRFYSEDGSYEGYISWGC